MSCYAKAKIAGYAALTLLGVTLSGCAGDPDPVYNQAFGFQCSNAENAVADVACSTRPPGRGTEHVSRYCYATIADANCFDRPDVDRQNQAQGSSGY